MSLTFDQLRERARPWADPISAASPTGRSARSEPAYEAVLNEVTKLESPTGAAVNWAEVEQRTGQLLQAVSKDLRLAAYLAYAMFALRGLDGAVTGTALLAELLDRYWPQLFPEANRMRARVGALEWFLDRMETMLPATKVGAADQASTAALLEAARWLAKNVRERFGSDAPRLGPILEAAERLALSARDAAPPPSPPPPVAAPPAAKAPAPTEAAPAPAPAAPPPAADRAVTPPAELSGVEDVANFLWRIGAALLGAGQLLRKASAADPLAYRLVRNGLWLPVKLPPVVKGTTAVPPIPPTIRERLERMEQNGRWSALLEEAESLMAQHRFSLDLQRYSASALAGLGPNHDDARGAVIFELATFLRRMPRVSQLSAADGTPFADERTRAWIQTEVLPSEATSSAAPPSAADPTAAAIAEARTLLASDKLEDALALLQRTAASCASGRARFLARLATAELCAAAGQATLARALYETLARESAAQGLEQWEPELAARCLAGLMAAARAKPAGEMAEKDLWNVIVRLTSVDIAKALKSTQ